MGDEYKPNTRLERLAYSVGSLLGTCIRYGAVTLAVGLGVVLCVLLLSWLNLI